MKLTVAYLTFRLHPRFEWLAASLARELRELGAEPSILQVLVIDGRLWQEGQRRRLELLDAAAGRIRFEHHPPKPTVWQGPHRLTKKDYFCAANTRNTALALARAPHVAFVDDLSVLRPGWLKGHLDAAEKEVLAGTTSKVKKLQVSPAGEILAFEAFPPGRDSRLPFFAGPKMRCGGASLFGGTFSVPLAVALRVNGQDEICDSIGGEDYDFGVRLERAGAAIYFSRDVGTYEDEDGHHAEAPMIRLDKPYPGPEGPYSSNRLLYRLLKESARTWTLGNEFDLRELREHVLAGGEFPVPKVPSRHWVDDQPLSEM